MAYYIRYQINNANVAIFYFRFIFWSLNAKCVTKFAIFLLLDIILATPPRELCVGYAHWRIIALAKKAHRAAVVQPDRASTEPIGEREGERRCGTHRHAQKRNPLKLLSEGTS